MKPGDSAERARKLAGLASQLAGLASRARDAVQGARQALGAEPSDRDASTENTELARKATPDGLRGQVEVAVK